MGLVLEGVEEGYYPLTSAGQHVPLGFYVLLLIFLYHFCFLQAFYRDYSSCFFLPAESDLPEGSSADDGQRLEISFADFLSFFS